MLFGLAYDKKYGTLTARNGNSKNSSYGLNQNLSFRDYSPGIYCDQLNGEITSRSLFAATNSFSTGTINKNRIA